MSRYVLENSSWRFHNGKPTIVLFGRDIETKELKTFGFQNFKPYFYYSDPNGKELNCYGHPITKCECTNPIEMRKLVVQYREHTDTFNSDLPYDVQFLIDRGISYGFDEHLNPVDVPLVLPRTLYFDIEVNIPEGLPIDEEKKRYPIPVITCMDSYTEDIVVFTCGCDEDLEGVINLTTERELLEAFTRYVKERNFDIITGWNSIEFDLPYIFGRAFVTGASLQGLSRFDHIYPDEKRIHGRSNIDMMVFFKDWSKPMGQQPSYGLKYIAREMCGFSYDECGALIGTLIERGDWKRIIEYAKNDVRALQIIDNKCGLIQYHENLRRIVGIKFEETIKRTAIVETLLMRQGIKPMPHRTKHDVGNFEGALVIQPQAGIVDDVITLDAKALYPTIIIAKKLSPDIDGMIPKAMMYILNERERYREINLSGNGTEIDKVTEQSLKYVANSFYGVMGSAYFKLYAREIAETITATGREINGMMQQVAKDNGYKVIGGDTDSIFTSPVKSVDEGKALESKVNDALIKWAVDNGIEERFAPSVKFEKFFKRMFFKKKTGGADAAKKKYAGYLIWKDGKEKDELSYTGIEIKRSDTAPITKRLMESFFRKVLIECDTEAAIDEIVNTKNELLKGRLPIHDIAIPKAIKANAAIKSAWAKGKENGEQYLNIRFEASKKPKLLYCKSPVREVCIDENIEDAVVRGLLTIDYEKMADRIITSKFKSLVESIGGNWEHLTLGQMRWGDLINEYDRR